MSTPYKTLHDIKAVVTARWKHPNCKFQRHEHAEVSSQVLPREWVGRDGEIRSGRSYVSQVKQRRVGRVGKVLAVSCNSLGKIRSNRAELVMLQSGCIPDTTYNLLTESLWDMTVTTSRKLLVPIPKFIQPKLIHINNL